MSAVKPHVVLSVTTPPKGISTEMGVALTQFVAVMVEKLECNKHKDELEPPDMPKLMRLAITEMGEVVEQLLRDEASPNMVRECADAANFCFLIAWRIQKIVAERKNNAAAPA